jgi:hypothetical protein
MPQPISGGTDLVGCFLAATPTLPVRPGEITRAALGMDVTVYDEDGRPTTDDAPGELVCRNTFPTVPLGIWGDDGTRLHDTYFARFPGVWTHGDLTSRTEHGGYVIHGRSDATLNVAGVRIGTGEIYAALEHVPEVADALAFAQSWDGDTRMVLLLVLAPGATLDDDLRGRIRLVAGPDRLDRQRQARQRQVRPGRQLAALVGVVVGVEHETPVGDVLDEDVAGGGTTGVVDGGEDHGVRFVNPGYCGLVEPPAELHERVSVKVPGVEARGLQVVAQGIKAGMGTGCPGDVRIERHAPSQAARSRRCHIRRQPPTRTCTAWGTSHTSPHPHLPGGGATTWGNPWRSPAQCHGGHRHP